MAYVEQMPSKLKQYRGPLSAEQAAKGIALARENAARLIADAELLLEQGSAPSASALAILTIEELGKINIIKTIVLHADGEQLNLAWKRYRNHRAKNVMWILPELAAKGARSLMQLRQATDISGIHTSMIDTIKQVSVYTDCFGDNGLVTVSCRSLISSCHLGLERERADAAQI